MNDCPFYDENREICDNGECMVCVHYNPPKPKPLFKRGDKIKSKYHSYEPIYKVEEITYSMYRLSYADSLWPRWKDIAYVNENYELLKNDL